MEHERLKFLGLKAKDPITQMQGVITSVCFDINGCVQAALTPPVNKDGAYVQSCWIDIQRLEIIDKVPVISVSDFKVETGCSMKPNR